MRETSWYGHKSQLSLAQRSEKWQTDIFSTSSRKKINVFLQQVGQILHFFSSNNEVNPPPNHRDFCFFLSLFVRLTLNTSVIATPILFVCLIASNLLSFVEGICCCYGLCGEVGKRLLLLRTMKARRHTCPLAALCPPRQVSGPTIVEWRYILPRFEIWRK